MSDDEDVDVEAWLRMKLKPIVEEELSRSARITLEEFHDRLARSPEFVIDTYGAGEFGLLTREGEMYNLYLGPRMPYNYMSVARFKDPAFTYYTWILEKYHDRRI